MVVLRMQLSVLRRRPTVVEGLYSGLGSGAALTATQLDIKMKLLVEAPAAVEDALASLLDHHDATLQVHNLFYPPFYVSFSRDALKASP
jgi:hypothetical protein